MENLPLIKFAELNRGIIIRDSFQDIFLIADIDGNQGVDDQEVYEHTMPMRLDALLMVLVLEGSSEIALDYVPYTIGTNSFTIIMPTHTIQLRLVKILKGNFWLSPVNFLMNVIRRSVALQWLIICN